MADNEQQAGVDCNPSLLIGEKQIPSDVYAF